MAEPVVNTARRLAVAANYVRFELEKIQGDTTHGYCKIHVQTLSNCRGMLDFAMGFVAANPEMHPAAPKGGDST